VKEWVTRRYSGEAPARRRLEEGPGGASRVPGRHPGDWSG
jgi:hypothetical protein